MTRIHEKGGVTEEGGRGSKNGNEQKQNKGFKGDHSDIGMVDHKINSGSKSKRGGGSGGGEVKVLSGGPKGKLEGEK